MNREIIDTLNRLNATFYRENSESFDRTRQSAWSGWERVVKKLMICGEELKNDGNQYVYRLLDAACGNMLVRRACHHC